MSDSDVSDASEKTICSNFSSRKWGQFADAVLQVLRTCALFPLKASVTASLANAIEHIRSGEVELLMIDSKFAEQNNIESIELVRSISTVPTIVFSRGVTRDQEEHLKRLGAQAVLSRESLDPLTLIETVESVLRDNDLGGLTRLINRSEQQMFETEDAELLATDWSEKGTRLAGASRLLKILNENAMPSQPQLEQLRRLYSGKERIEGTQQEDETL